MIVENDCRGSFQTALRVCKIAAESGESVEIDIWGRDTWVTIQPGDAPEDVYKRFNEAFDKKFPQTSGAA